MKSSQRVSLGQNSFCWPGDTLITPSTPNSQKPLHCRKRNCCAHTVTTIKTIHRRCPLLFPTTGRTATSKKVLDINWYLIDSDPQLQLIFPTKPFLSYKRNPGIHDHLVHTRFSTQGRKDPKETSTKLFVTPLGTESGFIRYQQTNPSRTLSHHIKSRFIQILTNELSFHNCTVQTTSLWEE